MDLRKRQGFGLVEMVVAVAILGGVAFLIARLSVNAGKVTSQASTADVAHDLSTRFRAALVTRAALKNTRLVNPNIAPCFEGVGCSAALATQLLAGPVPLELRDAANQVLVPAVASTVDDDGTVCSSGAACRWRVSAFFQPLACAAAGCRAPTFSVNVKLELVANPSSLPFKNRDVLVKNIPLEMWIDPASVTLASCTAGKYLAGFNADGTANCQLLPTINQTCPVNQFACAILGTTVKCTRQGVPCPP